MPSSCWHPKKDGSLDPPPREIKKRSRLGCRKDVLGPTCSDRQLPPRFRQPSGIAPVCTKLHRFAISKIRGLVLHSRDANTWFCDLCAALMRRLLREMRLRITIATRFHGSAAHHWSRAHGKRTKHIPQTVLALVAVKRVGRHCNASKPDFETCVRNA
eukprot:4468731-Pyramimonas_sp.AAC.1